jgi:hypothetical protein
MAFILLIVVGLVAWALHLMQRAIEHREFSLMLAGFLVSVAAAAMMAVYFLTNNCVGYLTQTAQHTYSSQPVHNSTEWVLPIEGEEDWMSASIGIVDTEVGKL